jgi:hypothetical protein
MKHKKHMDDITEVREVWKNNMASSKNKKMPRGAQYLNEIYVVPHKDQWRRKVGRHKKSG